MLASYVNTSIFCCLVLYSLCVYMYVMPIKIYSSYYNCRCVCNLWGNLLLFYRVSTESRRASKQCSVTSNFAATTAECQSTGENCEDVDTTSVTIWMSLNLHVFVFTAVNAFYSLLLLLLMVNCMISLCSCWKVVIYMMYLCVGNYLSVFACAVFLHCWTHAPNQNLIFFRDFMHITYY